MKKKILIGMLLALMSLVVLGAAPFSLEDLMLPDEPGLPSLSLREPLPWGVEPLLPLPAIVRLRASSMKVEVLDYSYAFGLRKDGEKSLSTWHSDGSAFDWSRDGQVVSWIEGDIHYFWSLPDSDGERRLFEYKGSWASPEYVKIRFRAWPSEPETWTLSDKAKSIYLHTDGEGSIERWMRESMASSVKWTAFSEDGGKALRRLLVGKDAKGLVTRVEYWSAADSLDLKLEATRNEGGGRLVGTSEPGNSSLEVAFGKANVPLSLKRSYGDGFKVETKFAADANGFVATATTSRDGEPLWRKTIMRDPSGLPLASVFSLASKEFGETVWRDASKESMALTPRKPGESLAAIGRPAELAAWLSGEGANGSESTDGTRGAQDSGGLVGSADKGAWTCSVSTDALTDEKTSVCMLESPDKPFLEYAFLVIRKKASLLEAYVNFGTGLDEDKDLAIRFDNDPPIYLSRGEWSKSTTGNAAFINSLQVDDAQLNTAGFARLLGGHERLLVQATRYDSTKLLVSFSLKGFLAAIGEISTVEEFLGGDEAEK